MKLASQWSRQITGIAAIAAVLTLSMSSLFAASAYAAVAVGGTTSTTASDSSSQIDLTKTISSGSNTLLLVGVSIRPSSSSVQSITWRSSCGTSSGSQSLSLVSGTAATAGSGTDARTEIWRLVAPTTRTNGHVCVTMTPVSGNDYDEVVVGATSFTGVDQSTPIAHTGTNSGSNSNSGGSVSVTSTSGNLAFGVLAVHNDNTPSDSQTNQWLVHTTSPHHFEAVGSTKSTSAGTTSFSWTGTGSTGDEWAASAVEIKAVASLTDQTITFGSLSNKTYGDADFGVSATGGGSGNPVTFASQTTSVCTTSGTNGATVHIVAQGSCTIRASQAGNGSYNAAPDVDQAFTVAKKGLTLTGMTTGDHTYDGSPTVILPAVVSGGTLNGVVSPDVIGFDASSAGFVVSDGNVAGSPHAVSVTGITLTGTAAGNYSLTQPTDLTVNVVPLAVTITPHSGLTKVYGTTDPTFDASTYESTSLVGADTISGTLGRDTSSEDVGTYAFDLGSLDAGTNYSLSLDGASPTFEITQAPATFSFSHLWQHYTGSALTPSVWVTPSEDALDSGITFNPATLAFSQGDPVDAMDVIAAGVYHVIASLATPDTNYTPVGNEADFHILKAHQWITFPSLSNLSHSAPDFDPGATASSGLPVTYTAWGHCFIVGNMVHLDGTLGFCKVTAHQDGDSNYHPAWHVHRWFWVTNTAPVLDPIADQSIALSGQVDLFAHATDADTTDTITYSLDTLPPGLSIAPTIDPSTGEFEWNSNGSGPTVKTFTVIASDGLESVSTSFTVTVSENPDTSSDTGNGGGGGGNGPVDGITGGPQPSAPGLVLGASTSTVPENTGDNGTTTPDGTVLGATTFAECSADHHLITKNLGIKRTNPADQVNLLEKFLNTNLNLGLSTDGVFNADVEGAVKTFQGQHVADVLTPWGITDPTGFVGPTTRRMIDIIACGADYPVPGNLR